MRKYVKPIWLILTQNTICTAFCLVLLEKTFYRLFILTSDLLFIGTLWDSFILAESSLNLLTTFSFSPFSPENNQIQLFFLLVFLLGSFCTHVRSPYSYIIFFLFENFEGRQSHKTCAFLPHLSDQKARTGIYLAALFLEAIAGTRSQSMNEADGLADYPSTATFVSPLERPKTKDIQKGGNNEPHKIEKE